MAGAEAPPPTGVVARKLVFTFVGVFLFAAGLTLLFEGMRAVMEVGGSCASGGPYQVRQECPDGTGLIFAGIFGGLLGTGLVVAGTFRDGPKLWTLAWPALFLSLGWNFLDYGIDPPPSEDGLVWGWLICAVLFLAMGGIPLLFLLWYAKATLWGTENAPRPATAAARARFATVGSSRRPMVVRFGESSVTTAPPPQPPPPAPPSDPGPPRASEPEDDLVSDLERLAALHQDGQLSDEEFARAKAARLGEGA